MNHYYQISRNPLKLYFRRWKHINSLTHPFLNEKKGKLQGKQKDLLTTQQVKQYKLIMSLF